MSRKLFIAATLLIGPPLLTSAALAGPCASNVKYSIWVNTSGFSCTVGDKTFSNFSFSSGTGLTASQFTVGPDTIAPSGELGLIFSTGALSVVGSGTEDATIDFTVTTSGALINDARLAIAGAVTGSGSATVGETLSPSDLTLTASLPSDPVDQISFSPTDSVGVLKDAEVIGFTGTTSISAIENDFSQIAVPEPASLTLLGTMLVGFGLFGRRRKRV